MKKKYLLSAVSALTSLAMLLPMTAAPAMAAAPEDDVMFVTSGLDIAAGKSGSLTNTSGDGGADMISLSADRTFQVKIPVAMTEAEAAAAAQNVVWSLIPVANSDYLDPELFPNLTEGGAMSEWKTQAGTPLFENLTTTVEADGEQAVLVLEFNNICYFYGRNGKPDYSAPHSNGGAYMDVCGYFDLTAAVEGEKLGSVEVKIAPYDKFHTMKEIYEELDKMVAFADENTDLYVVKKSMGMSQGDNGLESLDMPYLVVAKSEAAVEKWQKIVADAKADPSAVLAALKDGTLGDYQVPVMYSNVHANEVAAADGIVNFAWMLLKAAAGDGKISYDTLTGFTAEGEAQLEKELGPKGEQGSVAIPDLVADKATYLGYLKAGNSVSAVVDLEKYYTVEENVAEIKDLLDDVFFILVPEENVEGRTYLTRTSSGGFDLNRDNSFQTQAETQNITALIAQWNPVSFTEFHGRVQTFQCEPCDPPHEPNFEYDLLAEHLMTGGEALGIGAVANNTKHNSYVIPQRDYLSYNGQTNADGSYQTQWYDPWDDMSTSYTPQYAMLHGTVSYTVEVPAYDDAMATALAYGQLSQSAYIADNKADYLKCQMSIWERGKTNANSNAYELVGQWFTDQYDVEGAEMDTFRPEYDGEGQNGNFYPECYIIPMDSANQHNLQAAADMIEWLSRNGVEIMVADSAFTYDGVTYPAGTAVISMYQVKRSVANGALYDGTVITGWPVLYSEGITAFNHTRGFDMVTCAEPAAYAVIDAACSVADDLTAYLAEQGSEFTGVEDALVIVTNSSTDSAAAVNALLQAGKTVAMITEGANKGSFLCSYADWQTVSAQFTLTGIGVAEKNAPASKLITKAPVIYICGKGADNASGFVKSSLVSGSYEYNYDRQALEMMGFLTTEDPAEADLIIGAGAVNSAALEAIKSGTPYIGYGRRVNLSALFADGALVRKTAGGSAMDALAYVTYPTESMITASYVAEGDNILYGYGAGYFESIPEGAQVLVQLDGSKELLEGFIPATGDNVDAFLNDSVQAFAYEGKSADGDDLDIVLFANTLTNKVHQQDEFSFVSNTAFSKVLGDSFTETEEEPAPDAITYTIVKGDSLWKLAVKFYGNGFKWSKIYQANKDTVKNPNVIYVGSTLVIPVN